MKTLKWIKFLETQKTRHGKVLFRVAELANAAGRSHHALNVELARLVKNGVTARYATGVYGLPGAATAEHLVATLDADAYITGMFALYRHNLGFVELRAKRNNDFLDRLWLFAQSFWACFPGL